ncbi:MAG TPA: serine acetyltransferase [Candidatus Mailhella merdigallinarum]|uniref:serine O-acetyltransferase n=1 Tax=Candidatus Mailhella merdigallinarum TaxID=2838658 RepID=A0A9D2HDY2_9BACT|nr:serine acetyltransferase [Desulfovibrionaceae bacterium]PWM69224.1 MAG: serine acetyltransferase [Desulfovibrionaceae bacterium]HJA08667.1 serine acetyltransferase [Candidatus Mailhella merdigallinarum]
MDGLDAVAAALSHPDSLAAVVNPTDCDAPMPSQEKLVEILDRIKEVIFPGYFGPSRVHTESLRYHMAANLDSIYRLLAEQIRRGGCFARADYARDCRDCEEVSQDMAMRFLKRLPDLRRLLALDARAAYEGDPAATSPGETIFCYPSLLTMTHHRIAHELYLLKVPVIPRIITEMAHSRTGIDIHPGASIGENFFIDHGTGVVIGETCIIGNGCRLYQGVTLGALSFAKGEDGTLVKGIPRHPILEDNVTVYAGASILGRVTIGQGSVIGGNVWLTHDVPPGSKIVQSHGSRAKPGELQGDAGARR